MKNRKLMLAVLVLAVVVLVGSCLSAVWGAKKTYTDDATKFVEVSWYMVGDSQPDADAVSAEATKYLKTRINAGLKLYMYDWGTWFGRIPTMMAASEPFDVFYTPDWLQYWDYYNRGALLPLNDLIDQYAPKTKKQLGEFRITGGRIDGVNYALPMKKEMAGCSGFMFQKRMIDKYKFDLSKITKAEDVEPWLETIKKNEPDMVPFGATGTSSVIGLGGRRVLAGGDVPGVLDDNDASKGKVYNQYESARYKQLALLNYKWRQLGYITDVADNAERHSTMRDNGMVFCEVAPLKPGKDKEDSNEKSVWIQKYINKPVITNSAACGSQHAISVSSKNAVRAMKMLEIANSDPYFCNLITFGIEGKHYTKVGKNVVKRIPQSGYAPFVWETCNQYLQFFQEGEDQEKWIKMEAFDKSAKPAPDLGFWYNKEVFSNEINAISGSITTQYVGQLNTGTVDPNVAIPEFVKLLKEAGADALIADMQKQYDDWKIKTKKK